MAGIFDSDDEDEESEEESSLSDSSLGDDGYPATPKNVLIPKGWRKPQLEDQYQSTAKILATLPMFRSCHSSFMTSIARRAPIKRVEPGEVLLLKDEGPMYVVEAGCVEIYTGDAAPTVLGAGHVLNTVGMLSLRHEAEPFRPRASSDGLGGKKKGLQDDDERPASMAVISKPYTLAEDTGQVPRKFIEGCRPGVPLGIYEDYSYALYNLCPHALPVKHRELSDWVEFCVRGAKPGSVPLFNAKTAPRQQGGGATVRMITRAIIEEVGHAAGPVTPEALNMRKSLAIFVQAVNKLADVWRTIMVRGGQLVPAAPPEITWSLAEISQLNFANAGQCIVTETVADPPDAIHIIDEGMAVVEKFMPCGEAGFKIAEEVVIGHLGPGALIGDVCMVMANIPAPCTVRAKTSVEFITIPSEALVRILTKYPGFAQGMHTRIHDITTLLMMRLPQRVETISCFRLFLGNDVSPDFITDVANATCREWYMCGHRLKQQGTKDSTCYFVEYGWCNADVQGLGKVAEAHPGNCFGERALVHGEEEATATIRVLSPFAICLTLTGNVFNLVMNKHPKDRRRINKFKHNLSEFSCHGKNLSTRMQVFSNCSLSFLEELSNHVERYSYLPGQTVTVEGHQDACQMFLLRGGSVVVEADGKKTAELSPGAHFGELAMLGAVRRRVCTVRALTFCFTLEITRESFLGVLVKYPEAMVEFEKTALQHMNTATKWAIFDGAPLRFIYLVNIYSERANFDVDDERVKDPKFFRGNAVLVTQGTCVRMSKDGVEIEELGVGNSFNEHILLGIESSKGEYLVTKTECELQIVTAQEWYRVLSEFELPVVEGVKRSVMKVLADKAEEKLGFDHGSGDLVRTSALFRQRSTAFVEFLASRLVGFAQGAGAVLTGQGEAGKNMHILLSGTVFLQDSHPHVEYTAGKILGESVLLGTSKKYEHTIRTASLTIFKIMQKEDFNEACQKFPSEATKFSTFFEEAAAYGEERMVDRLLSCHGLRKAPDDFVEILAEGAEDEWFAPGEAVVQMGEPCMFGKAALYLLFAGNAIVEGKFGVRLAALEPGHVFGESGAVGLVETRTATVRAPPTAPLHVVKVRPETLEEALRHYPEVRDVIEHMAEKRQEKNRRFSANRETWLEEIVIPTLSATPLLAGVPSDILNTIGAALTEVHYEAGDIIAKGGENATSMLCLLQGRAEVLARDDSVMGIIEDGAVFGEVAVLGLLTMRTGTLRALTPCRVLPVTSDAVGRALSTPQAKDVQLAFAKLIDSRQKQVEKGLPLSVLELPICADDTSVRAIALQAERVELDRGELWELFPDCDPSGPHLGILTKGHARLEAVQDGRYITSIAGRALILEGLATKYKAQLRAETKCVGYRMRRIDLNLAASNVDKVPKWMSRFSLLERDVYSHLQMKLVATKGAIEGCAPHPCDSHISQWKKRKEKAVSRSKEMQEERRMVPPSASQMLTLPPVPYDYRSAIALAKTKSLKLQRGQSAPELRKQLVGKTNRSSKVDASPYKVLDFETQITRSVSGTR